MYRGLFWVTDDGEIITYKIPCDADGVMESVSLPYNSRRGDSFTHKATWKEAAQNQAREIRSKAWNHFPRGRVEIKPGKVTVFLNPILCSPDFEQRIRNEFLLTDESLTLRFIPDHSNHYHAANER